MKTFALSLLLGLAASTAALASVPGIDLPQLNFPQPTDTVTQGCANPGTLTGTCAPVGG